MAAIYTLQRDLSLGYHQYIFTVDMVYKMASITAKKIEDYIRSIKTDFEQRLAQLVEIPTISNDPNRRLDIERGADLAIEYLRSIGAKAEKVTTKGNPVVYGEIITGEDNPTIVIYNHLDIQPALEPGWKQDPFKLKKVGNRYIGRGATDDKGPSLSILLASKFAMENRIPINIKFIWEFEEEIGSPNFESFLLKKKKEIVADSILISDTIWISRGRPAISYAIRGLVGARLILKTGRQDAHSGLTGGVARNPLGELCHIISSCYKAKTGRVLIPGFYDDVRPVSKREIASALESGFDVTRFKRDHNLIAMRTEDRAETIERIWFRPTFEPHGLVGGYSGNGIKTIVPPSAEAKISMRLVPDQDPRKIFQLFSRFIRKQNPDIMVVPEGMLEPYYCKPSGLYPDAAMRAVYLGFGKEPQFVREGGSIGAVSKMQKHLGVPIILLGLSLPEHAYHGPNEYFDWGQASGGIRTFIRYLEEISRIPK